MGGMKDHAYGDTPAPYPASPGWKAPGTSQEAAGKVASNATILRDQVMQEIKAAGQDGITADDVAARLHKSVLAVRPRVSELYTSEQIQIAGRGKNASGMTVNKWRAP